MTAIDRTALPMTIEGGDTEFRTEDFGAQTVAWVRLPKGADLRPGLAGLPGDLSQRPHWGYMLAGRIKVHTADGPQTLRGRPGFLLGPRARPRGLRGLRVRRRLAHRGARAGQPAFRRTTCSVGLTGFEPATP